MDDFWALPPVARYVPLPVEAYILLTSWFRTLTAITFVESALCYSHVLNYYFVPFIPQLVLQSRPEIWRLLTPYFLTDPKLNVLFDLYFSISSI